MGTAAVAAAGETRTRHLGRGHIAALDGVRGLAVLGVMASHLVAGDVTRLPRPLVAMLSLGVCGVDVFFVLSGFLITGILRDSLGDGQYFRKFYARRVLRIFPLYYGVLFLLLLLTRPLGIDWHGVQWSLLLYLQNTHSLLPSLMTFHTAWFSVDHLWSLAVEEQFYLVWPLAVALLRSGRQLLLVCCAGLLLSFALRVYCLQAGFGFDWVNRNTLCRADQLLAGAAVALLLRSRLAGRTVRLGKPLLLVCGAGMLVQQMVWAWLQGLAPSEQTQAWLVSTHYTITLLFAAGLILCCVEPLSRLRKAMEWKHIRWLGKYSYGLYVLHLLLLPSITLLLLEPLRTLTGSKIAARLLIAVLVFCLSVVAAYVSFHAFEKHFLRLKRFFDYTPVPPAKTAL